MGQSVDIYSSPEVGRTKIIYSIKAHACNFVLDAFCNGETSAVFAGRLHAGW